jgi:hypothetical protein
MSATGRGVALAAVVAVVVAARLLDLPAPAVWAAGVLVVVVPGWAVVRLLRLEEALGLAGSAVVATAVGIALWAPGLAFVLAAGLPFGVVEAITGAIALPAVAAAILRPPPRWAASRAEVAAGAVAVAAFAYLSWRMSTGVVGDGLFHAGRMRKLDGRPELSLSAISSFLEGSPHAGYAFPLLHGAWTGVARLAGVDPLDALVHLLPLCAALAALAAAALGTALTGWRTAGWIAAAALGWDLFTLINGLVLQIVQPPPFTFFVLLPAALLALWAALRGERRAVGPAVVAAAVATVVHPTYAVPLLVLGAGLVGGAWLTGRAGGVRAHVAPALAAGALSAAAVAAIAGWVWWVALRGGTRTPVLSHADEYVLRDDRAVLMYPWAPVFGRGYVLLAILACAALLTVRRLVPLVVAMLALLAVLLVPGVNTLGLAVMGMGQFHRFWQVLPWPYVLAAAACLAALRLGRWALPAAAAVAALTVWLRDWREFWREPTSWVVVAGVLLAVAALVWTRAGRRAGDAPAGRAAWPAAALLLGAAALAGPVWYGRHHVVDQLVAGPSRGPMRDLTIKITPGAIDFFRAVDGRPPVVLGDPEDVFQLIAMAEVYAQALPEARTRAEPRLRSRDRRHDLQAFFSAAARPAERAAILRRWRVDYVLVNVRDQPPAVVDAVLADPALTPVYRDPASAPRSLGRFVILRASAAAADRSAGDSPAGSASA